MLTQIKYNKLQRKNAIFDSEDTLGHFGIFLQLDGDSTDQDV